MIVKSKGAPRAYGKVHPYSQRASNNTISQTRAQRQVLMASLGSKGNCGLGDLTVTKQYGTRGVSHCGLAIYIKKYLKAKDELGKLKYFTMQ
jgi:hypothetical protein